MIGVVAALAAEARHLTGATATAAAGRGAGAGSRDAPGILVEISGMGGAGAARAAQRLVSRGATALASFGLAGGLDPSLSCGRIVLPAQVVSADGGSLGTDTHWRTSLTLALAAHAPVAVGKLLTRERAIGSPGEKQAAFRATGAAAVDMESFSVAEVAAERKLAFMVVRVIVDTAEDTVPSSVLAGTDAGGQVHLWPLVRSLLRTPADLGALLKLAARYRRANASLRIAAREGVLAMPPSGRGTTPLGLV